MAKRIPLSAASKTYELLCGKYNWLSEVLPKCKTCTDLFVLQQSARTLDDDQNLIFALEDPFAIQPEELVGFARWRNCKQVYRIDSVVAEELKEQKLAGSLPVEVISHLPYPIIYIDTKLPFATGDSFVDAKGFLAWIDAAIDAPYEKVLYLEFIGVESFRGRATVPIKLREGATLEEIVQELIEIDNDMKSREQSDQLKITVPSYENSYKVVTNALNLLLYVISEEDDAEIVYQPPKPSRGQKVGKKTNPETITELGTRIGRSIGAARKISLSGSSFNIDGSHSKSPHVRRGHWHSFWTGKRKDRDDNRPGDKLVVHWIPPTYINADGDEIPIEVVHQGVDTPHG